MRGRLNILVAGGTGAGKTTMLNVLSSFIPADERIVTIEDAAELQLRQPHVVRLESRPPNIEGRGEITIRDLVRNALRMRPDRIVVGEVRGGEALDMLQAMNTGHDGSLTTVHANSPRDALSRLETMVLMAGVDLPMRAIREQISSAIDLIVHQSRLKDGTRRLTHITEVVGMEGDVITLQDIFTFDYGPASTRTAASAASSSPPASAPVPGAAQRPRHPLRRRPVHLRHRHGPPGDASMTRRTARAGVLLLAGVLLGSFAFAGAAAGQENERLKVEFKESDPARGSSGSPSPCPGRHGKRLRARPGRLLAPASTGSRSRSSGHAVRGAAGRHARAAGGVLAVDTSGSMLQERQHRQGAERRRQVRGQGCGQGPGWGCSRSRPRPSSCRT